MAEASRSRVTITLGRSGQVVKRAGSGMDGSLTDQYPVPGSKRSVRDRLGRDVDSSGTFNNKRFRGDARASNGHDEIHHLSKEDLRHKIKKKHIQRQSQNGQRTGIDLRSILSRPAKPPTNIMVSRQRTPERDDSEPSYRRLPDPREQLYTGTRDRGQLVHQTWNSDQRRDEYRNRNVTNTREQHVNDSRVGSRRDPEMENVRHSFSEPNSSSGMANVSDPRATNTMNKVDSRFNPHSPWNMDQLRRRSPDEALPASRTIQPLRRRSPEECLPTSRTLQPLRRRSPEAALPTIRTLPHLRRRSPDEAFPSTRTLQQFRRRSPDEALPTTRALGAAAARSHEELHRRYNARTYDDSKPINMSRDAFDFSRPLTFSSVLTKTAPVGSVRTLAASAIPAPQLPQSSTLAQRGSYVLDDNVTVDSLLKLLNLERYSILFKAEEVDMYSLKRMTESDLKDMGVPMGPRKKLLLALQPRLRRQA